MLLSPEGKTGGTRHIFVPAEKKIPKIRDIVMRFPPDNMDMTDWIFMYVVSDIQAIPP